MLDKRTPALHIKPTPPNPGTKHLSQRERWIGKSLCTHAHLGKRCGRMKKARAGCSHPRFLSIQPLERSGRRQSCLGLLDDGTECGAFVHRQVGHDLPIELDPGELSAVDELRVGQALGTHRRVDPLDPQRAEVALLNLAVAIGVLTGLFDGLTGNTDRVLAAAAVALGLFENPLVLLASGYAALDTGHALVPPQSSP